MANGTRAEVQRYADIAIEDARNLATTTEGVRLGEELADHYGIDADADWLDLLDAMALEVYGTKYTNREGLVAVTVVTGIGGPHVEFTIDQAGRVVGSAHWGNDSAKATDWLPDLFGALAELVEIA